MHVNPVTSDGLYTIGYDADGVAGQWDGNMSETTDYFRKAQEGDSFCDGNEDWLLIEDMGELVWLSPDGNIADVSRTLKMYGDK